MIYNYFSDFIEAKDLLLKR